MMKPFVVYCDGCARSKDWPISRIRRFTSCEFCDRTETVCNFLKRSKLPRTLVDRLLTRLQRL